MSKRYTRKSLAGRNFVLEGECDVATIKTRGGVMKDVFYGPAIDQLAIFETLNENPGELEPEFLRKIFPSAQVYFDASSNECVIKITNTQLAHALMVQPQPYTPWVSDERD